MSQQLRIEVDLSLHRNQNDRVGPNVMDDKSSFPRLRVFSITIQPCLCFVVPCIVLVNGFA